MTDTALAAYAEYATFCPETSRMFLDRTSSIQHRQPVSVLHNNTIIIIKYYNYI